MENNLSSMQECLILSLGQEDPLDKIMATHSSILAREFHGQRNLVTYSLWGCTKVRHDLLTKTEIRTNPK